MSSVGAVTLIDGGMGHELKVRGVVTDGSFLAGVLANEAHPGEVTSVHRDFIHSGCRVVTTNSFVAVPLRMQEGEGGATDRATRLILAAVRCARGAIASSGVGDVRIAGCVPPLTDCYVSLQVPEDWVGDLVPTYEGIVSALLSGGVDVLLAETLSTIREGLAVVRAISRVVSSRQRCRDMRSAGSEASVQNVRQSLWLSFTVSDDSPEHLRSGELLEDALDAVCSSLADEGCVDLDAIGVNCSAPGAVSSAVRILASRASRMRVPYEGGSRSNRPPKVLAYANAFRTTTSEWLRSLEDGGDDHNHSASDGNCSDASKSMAYVSRKQVRSEVDSDRDYDRNGCMLPDVYARHAISWVEAGASIVGGCCGCSPRHIRAIADKLKSERR